ncbi:MAG: glycosyltransferase family 2 protein [Gemmatimonadales bacterium]|nr:MAG: glycosyltransferase family 2 protein [Gemmatimonadales bacterium]
MTGRDGPGRDQSGRDQSGRDGPGTDGPGRWWDRVALIIPALDEEEALPRVLTELRELGLEPGRVVVVDNGSKDGTARVAARSGARVVQEPRKGYGAACLAGLGALTSDPDPPAVVAFMDGDGSDDPRALRSLVDPILEGCADFVVGVRQKEVSGGVPIHARLGDALVRKMAWILHGVRLGDLGPFRAIRWTSLEALDMDDRDWGWTLQMQLRAHARGLRYLEVSVPHRARLAGRSKVSGALVPSLRAGLKMFRVLVAERGSR